MITFCTSRIRREMYISHMRLSACLSVAAFPHYCSDPDENWGMVRVPLVVHYWADLQSVQGFVAMITQSEREILVSACTCSMPGFYFRPTIF